MKKTEVKTLAVLMIVTLLCSVFFFSTGTVSYAAENEEETTFVLEEGCFDSYTDSETKTTGTNSTISLLEYPAYFETRYFGLEIGPIGGRVEEFEYKYSN